MKYLALAGVLAACGPSAAGGGIDAAPGNGDGGLHGRVASITITPADPVLISVDGSQPQVTFIVTAHYSDGTSADVGAAFLLSSPQLGDINYQTGQFTAFGTVGGAITVEADYTEAGSSAHTQTSLTVKVQRSVLGGGTPPDGPGHFGDPPVTDAARQAIVDYPLDGAVMPQNVYPADVQWERGNTGDVYRVRLEKPHATGLGYVIHTGASFTYDWLADAALWRQFAESDPDQAGTITVDRWDSAAHQVVLGTPLSLRFPPAALAGAIYYWDIAAGRVVRIDDGTANRTQIMPNPPAGTDGAHCVGCHVVSRNGRWFVGRLGGGDNVGAIFDLTTDLTGNPPPTTFAVKTTAPTSPLWWFSTFNPSATRLLYEENLVFGLLDPQTGASVPLAGGSSPLPSSASTHPAWAPDGSAVAYVSGANAWGGIMTACNLSMLPVTGADSFGPSTGLHTAAMLGNTCDSYPSWSPDSKLIAFASGTGSRSEDQTDALYLMNRDGSNVVKLAKGAGGTTDYHPNFSPFQAAGYYWMTFLSKRPYGNAQVGTKASPHQQLWVTAVKVNASGGVDPSEVAYWIPGQATASQNISAFWAPQACRNNGDTCTVGAVCCSGLCGPDGKCVSPPPDQCRVAQQTCGGAGDCCLGLMCTNNVCTYNVP